MNEDFKNLTDYINNNINNSNNKNSNNKNIDLIQIQIDRYNNIEANDKIYLCKKCKNKGLIFYKKENENMGVKKCSCYYIRKNREKMKEIGLLDFLSTADEILKEKEEEQEEWKKKMLKIANDFIQAKEKNKEDYSSIFYGGAVGGGKTTICANILSKLIYQNSDLMADYFVWDSQYKDLIFNDENHNKLEWLKNVDILFIDDFFRIDKSKGLTLNQNERDIAKNIIDYRYRFKKTTIITSELYLNEIEELDEAIGTRIYEMCSKGKYIANIKRDKTRNQRKVLI